MGCYLQLHIYYIPISVNTAMTYTAMQAAIYTQYIPYTYTRFNLILL